MIIKSKEEIDQMEKGGKILYDFFMYLMQYMKVGASPKEIAYYVRDCFKNMKLYAVLPPEYPDIFCISVNEVAAHGVPNDREFQEGDVVSIDISFSHNNWVSDGTWSYTIGDNSPESRALVDAAWRVARAGVQAVRKGGYAHEIAEAISIESLSCGVEVFSEFCGHGIGRSLHEKPKIFHTWNKWKDFQLPEGLVITIEPIVTFGKSHAQKKKWSFVQAQSFFCAQFEHMVAIYHDGPRVLSLQNLPVEKLPMFPPF